DGPYPLRSPRAPPTRRSSDLDPASPQPAGTTVLWTASASGCTSAEYLITFPTPSGVWSVPQNWSANATFSWNTTGLANGEYLFKSEAHSTDATTRHAYVDVTH